MDLRYNNRIRKLNLPGRCLWGVLYGLEKLAISSFINEMLELANAVRYEGEHRLLPLLLVLKEEVKFPPTFYNLDELTSKLKSPSIRIEEVVEKLKKLNFIVTKTHFDERGIKTDAKLEDLVNIIKG